MTRARLVYARPVTKQTWTAAVAAALFVVLAAIIALVPVPFVGWSAGSTVDLLESVDGKPRVEVAGATTHPVTGQLRLTTVSVTRIDAQLTLPEALLSHWLPAREVLPRSAVYPAGQNAEEHRVEETRMMDDSQTHAVAAGLRAAKIAVAEVPQVAAVSTSGPANNKLLPGDFVLTVDRAKVNSIADVGRAVRKHEVNEAVLFGVRRGDQELNVTVITAPANNDPATPVVGISLVAGYQYEPKVSFRISPEIGGPSAGLIFGLGVYDLVTPGDLVAGRSVAGTGTLAGNGQVGPIGGIQEKIAGAERAGASIFLVPAANCPDVEGAATSMRLVKVSTLSDAVSALQALADPARAPQVAGCR